MYLNPFPDADEAYQILKNFNPNTDRYSEEINIPKPGDVFIHLTSAFNADVRCELCDSVIHFRCMRPALRKSVKDKTNKNKTFECENFFLGGKKNFFYRCYH